MLFKYVEAFPSKDLFSKFLNETLDSRKEIFAINYSISTRSTLIRRPVIFKRPLSNRYVLLCLFKKIISQCSRIKCDNCAIITEIVTIHHKTANLLNSNTTCI